MAEPGLEQWAVVLDEFPVTGSDRQKLLALLPWAIRAPSSHNAQPWRFRVGMAHLELFADRSRSLRIADPHDRELTISCGAALRYLLIAARHFGIATEVHLLPEQRDPNLMARVLLVGETSSTTQVDALFAAIPQRRTSRRAFDATPLPESLCDELVAAAAAEGARLTLVRTSTQRRLIAHCVEAGDRIQMASSRFRAELARWLRPNGPRVEDGMPGFALGFGDVGAAAAPFAVRTLDLGESQASRDLGLLRHSPLLAMLETEDDTPTDWLAAGQALANVLLLAESAGVRSSFLNQPVEVPILRSRLAQVVSASGYPQMLLRMGYGRALPRPTPRRAVESLLDR